MLYYTLFLCLMCNATVFTAQKSNVKTNETVDIIPGETPKAYVSNKLGNPTRVEKTTNGETWFYDNFEINIAGKDEVVTNVIKLNKEGVVKETFLQRKATQPEEKAFKGEMNAMDSMAAFNEGMKYKRREMYKESIPYFKKSIELNPDFGMGYIELAYAYQSTNENDLAIENYEKGISLKADFMPAYVMLAQLYMQKGDARTAYHYAKEAQRLDPTNKAVNEMVQAFEKKFGTAIAMEKEAKESGHHVNVKQSGNLVFVGPQYYEEGKVPITPLEQRIVNEYERLIKEIEAENLTDDQERLKLQNKVKEWAKKYNMTEENFTYMLLKIQYREIPPDSYIPPSEE